MARVTDLGGTFRPIWIWDVDRKVGYGAGSSKPDVMLVQLALNKVLRGRGIRDERKGRLRSSDPTIPSGGFPVLNFLTVDGACGNETAYAIAQYQKATSGSADSAVDPVHPLVGSAPGKIIFRTMYSLNVDILRFTGRLLEESDFPPLLRADVSRKR